jgi:hypothetical protein
MNEARFTFEEPNGDIVVVHAESIEQAAMRYIDSKKVRLRSIFWPGGRNLPENVTPLPPRRVR